MRAHRPATDGRGLPDRGPVRGNRARLAAMPLPTSTLPLIGLQRGAGNRATAAVIDAVAGSAVSAGVARAAGGDPSAAPGRIMPLAGSGCHVPPALVRSVALNRASTRPRVVAPSAAAAPVARGLLDDVSAGVSDLAAGARDRALSGLTSYAHRMPGYKLLGVVLGRDVLTGAEVPRTAATLVGGFLELVPRGQEVFENVNRSGALDRASAWFEAEVPKLGLSWETIRGLFSRAWDALSVTDLADPAGAWAKIANIFGPPLGSLLGFARSAVGKAMEFVFEGGLALAGGAGEQVMAIIRRGGDVLGTIVNDPVRFAGNLVTAVRTGLGQFAANIGTHLQSGLIGWLTGALRAAVRLPARLDLGGIASVVLDLLGLSWPALRTRLVRLLGDRVVRAMETAVDWVQRIVTGGLGAVVDKILESATGLLDTVLGGIRDWVARSVVGAAVTKLISMFNPAGAIIQAVIAAYNTVQFFLERAQQLAAFASSVFDSIAKIATGSVGDAANAVEQALARSVPVVLGFLARLLGLGDIAAPVRDVVGRARGIVDAALDRVADWLASLGRRILGRRSGSGPREQDAPTAGAVTADGPGSRDPRVKQDALAEAHRRLTQRRHSSPGQIAETISAVFKQYAPRGLTSLRFDVTDEETMDSRLLATASPSDERTIRWSEIFEPFDMEKETFSVQSRNETYAAISLNGVRYGEVQASGGGRHAEDNLLRAYWQPVINAAKASVAAGRDTTVAIAINRAPCHMNCTPTLVGKLNAVEPTLKRKIRFVLAPTGIYEPTRKLTEEEISGQRKELLVVAKRLGRPASEVIRNQLNRVALTDDTTTLGDLRELVEAGWDVSQLDTGSPIKPYGKILAEAAHTVAKEAEMAKAGSG
ncbi:phage tail protein [Frankia gtarii]|uniref:phage tail protein n=1 Tax=Frankia gtarii TaxID=2950102 RepID=UPI0021C1F1A8|nr:hypothetical protein [Frankia gtarii]